MEREEKAREERGGMGNEGRERREEGEGDGKGRERKSLPHQ